MDSDKKAHELRSVTPKKWFSIGSDFCPPRGHLAMSGNVFVCHDWDMGC